MKRLMALAMICVAPLPAPAHAAEGGGAAQRWVEKTLRSMSVDEKVGQLLIPVTRGGFKSVASDDFQKLRSDVVDDHVGGYHVASGDVAGIALTINELQRLAKIPLLISADLEGGPGYVMFGATRFPLAMAIGATGSEQFAYAAGKATGDEARAIGVGIDFYPVVDVQNNPGNPIINIRSFGEDPNRVAALSTAYLKGVQDAGVLATAKHFPGHGDVATDSHLEMPILSVSRERLESLELVPFRAAIDAGVAGVMSAHMYVPSIEPQKGLPSTLSHAVLTDLLRSELKFQGLVITDAMDMHGITNNYTEADATVRAFLAGADIILFPPHTDTAFNALKAAVQDGRISAARLDDSVRRILAAKARIGLDHYKPADVNHLGDVVGSKAHRDLAQEISDNAVTLVRDEKHTLPVAPSAEKRVLQITLLDSRAGWREGPVGLVSAAETKKRFPNAITIQLDDGSTRNEFDMARQLAGLVDVVVVDAFIRVAAYKGSIDLTAEQMRFLHDLSALQKPFVFALFGSPYVLQHLPELPSYILTYDTNPGSELSAIKAITGEIPFRGRLPVSLPGFYRVGDSASGGH